MNTKINHSNGHLSSGPVLICLILILAVSGLYHQVRSYEFVSFDDSIYVTDNRQVKSGITRASIVWAFSFKNKNKTYWHPLAWISHMLDVHLYGMAPGRHHLTSVLFHIASTLLLFGVLHRMTGHIWRSAFVAALFALHPINVESVAWVAERKNVLSTFFWMLTMLLYCYYVQRRSLTRYAAVLGVYILGLLAKPMLVTLPFVLLLLDYWPLGRLDLDRPLRHQLASALGLIVEKVPLLIFSAISVYLSTASVRAPGEVISYQTVPLSLRVANAAVSYIQYMTKMIWPQDLAVFYPYPEMIPLWQVGGASAILIGISVFVLWSLKRRPYLAVGWLWYLGTLVPVMGLMQVGLWPAMADRWAYVPLIGLFIMVAWSMPDYLSNWHYKKIGLTVASTILILALMGLTGLQIRYWASNFTLYDHALKVTSQNHVAHNNLGVTLLEKNKFAQARQHFAEAIRLKPDQADGYYNIGVIFEKQNNMAQAMEYYAKALKKNSKHIYSHNNFGNALVLKARYHEAIQHYSVALILASDDPEIHNNLGVAFMHVSEPDQAIEHFRRALEIRPGYTDAATNLQKATKALKPIN